MPESYTIPRTGNVPLAFDGELIAEADSWSRDGPGNNRWHDLKLYRTGKGRYVLWIGYRSRYAGEGPRDEALVLASPEDLRNELSVYDPAPEGVGFPPHPEYRDKQERMLANLRFRFGLAVKELFDGLGDEVAERVD